MTSDLHCSQVRWEQFAALDLGVKHTRGLQALSRVMGHHGRGVKPCPVCDVPGPLACLLDHVLKDHWEILDLGNDLLTIESLLTLVVNSIISFVSMFRKLFYLNSLELFACVCTCAPLWVLPINL